MTPPPTPPPISEPGHHEPTLPPLTGSRRQARERALSLLYEAELKEVSPAEVLGELPVEPLPFATELVTGVAEHLDHLDGYLRRFSQDWAVERMPAVDRTLLRLGVFELLHRPDVPTAAVISEAVELAQRYSTDQSSRFVNGMLAAIAREVRPTEASPHQGGGASSAGGAAPEESLIPDDEQGEHRSPEQHEGGEDHEVGGVSVVSPDTEDRGLKT